MEWNTKYHSLFTFQFSCCYHIFSYRSNQRMNMYDIRCTYIIIFFLKCLNLRKTFHMSNIEYIEKENAIQFEKYEYKFQYRHLFTYTIQIGAGPNVIFRYSPSFTHKLNIFSPPSRVASRSMWHIDSYRIGISHF